MASPSSSPETPRDDRRAHMGQDPVKAETAAGAGGDGAPEAVPSHTVEKWNDPRINIYRLLVTNYSFVIMGMSDACLGPLIPYIEEYYHVSYTLVSLLFLSSFVGYLVAALSNNLIHHHLGQRGVALIAPSARILGYVLLSLHLPFPALPPLMLLPGFGSGLEDSAWNAWIGNMESANELLGFLHGSYGLGATIGPLVSTAMVVKAGLPWYAYFYLMIGLAALELALTSSVFWGATAENYRATRGGGCTTTEEENGAASKRRTTTRTVMREPLVWLLSIFLLGYVGAENALGGWIVTFMLNVRHAQPFDAGLTVTFFWLGLAVGRFTLGFVTGKIGEKRAITAYLLLAIALQICYWLIPSFAASAVFVSFEGFFLGPLFPGAIVAAIKLLPVDYHISAIGFAAAFGGGGAAVVPFVVGAIASSQGVWVLQPIILAVLAFLLLAWLALPGGLRPGGLEHARETKEKIGHQVVMAYKWLSGKSSNKRT
ncbi:major facilitator superfamily domain-containing protein [Apiospora arundinis]|uniref:Major facilitator superfamily domain-containing protein n=1 Tax=Apiospora arundinis TaxID=335852 RepID=A0ABR2II68_9PEZI